LTRLFSPPQPPLPRLNGTVEAIALAERDTGTMHTVDHAKALANQGLDGDRYAAKAGTFTPANDTARGYDLTLIEAEARRRKGRSSGVPPIAGPWRGEVG
jgi:hypothetical protein